MTQEAALKKKKKEAALVVQILIVKLGQNLSPSVVKRPHFQCRGHGFDLWPGN